MNKAMARHYLKKAGWVEAEMLLAERVLRHNGSRGIRPLSTLKTFAEGRTEATERAAWARLIERIEGDAQQEEALGALLSL